MPRYTIWEVRSSRSLSVMLIAVLSTSSERGERRLNPTRFRPLRYSKQPRQRVTILSVSALEQDEVTQYMCKTVSTLLLSPLVSSHKPDDECAGSGNSLVASGAHVGDETGETIAAAAGASKWLGTVLIISSTRSPSDKGFLHLSF